MYTDDSILTWGKHKFTALRRVPVDWLLGHHKDDGCLDKLLLEYIEKNLDQLKERQKTGKAPPPLKFPCTKFIFATKSLAKRELKRIAATGHSNIPTRAYECPKCGAWHLTSKPIYGYEK